MAKSLIDKIFTADALKKTEKDFGTITVWIPLEYKIKYDALQNKTGRKFGKLLQEVLKKSIDQAESQLL